MVSKNLTELLAYRDWVQVNESDAADAVYFTVKFKETILIDELIVEAIKRVTDSISDVAKANDVSPDGFTLSLNEEESFDIFSDIGATEPVKVKIRIDGHHLITYKNIINSISTVFTQVSQKGEKTATFALKPGDTEMDDDDIIDEVVNSAAFIRHTDNTGPYRNQTIGSAQNFLRGTQSIERAFLDPDKGTRSKMAESLTYSLQKSVYYEVNRLLLESAKPFLRESIVLSDLKSKIDAEVATFRNRAKEISSAEEKKALVMDIFDFQRRMILNNSSNDIRRRIASSAIVSTYDLFGELGLTADDVIQLTLADNKVGD